MIQVLKLCMIPTLLLSVSLTLSSECLLYFRLSSPPQPSNKRCLLSEFVIFNVATVSATNRKILSIQNQLSINDKESCVDWLALK